MRQVTSGPRKHRGGAAGYTLIEFAIVMTVVGVMLGAFTQAWSLYNKTKAEQQTDQNISAVTSSLTSYLTAFGSYACPARLNALRTDPDYGVAGQCDPTDTLPVSVTNPAGPYVTIAPGSYFNGYYESTSDRKLCPTPPCPPHATTTMALTASLVSVPPIGPSNPFSPLVRRGMVPFRTLGLPETGNSSVTDGYGMRLQYAVTESLAVPGTYREEGGAIDIQDSLGDTQSTAIDLSLTPLVATGGGSVHYVIFSTGADKAGGFSTDGGQGVPCNAVALDGANCATSVSSVFKVGPYATVNGAGHFDDHLKYYSNVQSVLWRVSTPIGQHITDLINAGGGGPGLIGIGAAPVTGGAALQVTGNVLAESGVKAANLCPWGSDTTGCFSANLNSACAAGSYANSISGGVLQCVSSIETDCPAGQVAVGIVNNKVQCQVEQGCASLAITLCTPPAVATADVRFLPGVLSGGTWNNSASVSGASYWESWKCNGTTWQRQSQNGVCSCTAGSSSTTPLCSTYYGQGAGTYSGNVTITSTTVCPSGVTTPVTNTSACACTTTSTNRSQTCPSPDTGGPLTQTANWTCPSGTGPGTGGTGTWGSWATTGGTPCACNPLATQTQQANCPTGYSGGTFTQTSTMQCPAGTWGSWLPATPPGGTCPCTPQTINNPIGCVAPLTGSGAVYQQQWTCSPPTLSPAYPGTLYVNNCGTTTYTWQPVGTATTGYPAALSYSLYSLCSTQGQTVSCSTPDGTTYDHYNNNGCQCE